MFSEIVNQKFDEVNNLYNTDFQILDSLKSFILEANDEELFLINPYRLAKKLNINNKSLLKHLFYLTKVGLFDLNWDVHCTRCNWVTETSHSLKKVKTNSYCLNCDFYIDVSFDESVELTFTINENIKTIDLPIKFDFPEQIKSEINTTIESGKTRTVISFLDPGVYTFMCPITLAKGTINVNNEEPNEIQTIEIIYSDGKFAPNNINVMQGSITFLLKNEMDIEIGFILYPKELPKLDISLLDDRVSGFECINMPEFRAIFKHEVLPRRESLQVKDVTFLFTDIAGSSRLYEKLGDIKAYNIVRDYFDILNETIEKNEGVTVKTIGDVVISSFTKASNGMKAALDAQKAFNEYNQRDDVQYKIILKQSLHTGDSIVVNLNDRLDYFGSTVNMAARIKNLCMDNEILTTEKIINNLGVMDVLIDSGINKIKRFESSLEDNEEAVKIYKIDTNVAS
ncbi:MAG: adenylate/guanylate cyclase domain-containing protein [Spirochaetota bacterium]|nr:adenylate/guanylate cyclase domain-containing protein [Spirochaetota bacterium]